LERKIGKQYRTDMALGGEGNCVGRGAAIATPMRAQTMRQRPTIITRVERARPPLALKIFVVVRALGLISSTLLGITIAINNRAMRRTSIVTLIAGTVLPLLLVLV
jgi:hypothetical protein